MNKEKLVPKLRFKEFSSEWETRKLGELSKITSGGTPNRSKPNFWRGDIPWVTTSLIDFVDIIKAEEFITNEGLENSSAKLFPKGTILMAMYGQGKTRGKVAVLEIEASTNQACAAIISEKDINNRFLFHLLAGNYDSIRTLSNEGGQKNLSGGLLKSLKIPFSKNQKEQQKIATFLTAVDKKIALLQQKKSLLEQYKKGVMQQIFSQQLRFKDDDGNTFSDWEDLRLNDVLDLLTDFESNGSFASVKENVTIFEQKDYAWYVRATDLENNTALDKVKYVNEHSYNFLKKTPLFGKELLITKRGEIGKVYFFKSTNSIKATLAPNMYLLKLNNRADSKFVFYYFINIDGNKKLKRINASSTIGALYKDDVKAIKIGIPSIEEQAKIANFLTAIDAKIALVNTQLQNTQQFKKGLLQQLFV